MDTVSIREELEGEIGVTVAHGLAKYFNRFHATPTQEQANHIVAELRAFITRQFHGWAVARTPVSQCMGEAMAFAMGVASQVMPQISNPKPHTLN